MDFGGGSGDGGAQEGSNGDGHGQGSPGMEGLKRKWTELEDSMKTVMNTMKATKDAVVQENSEQSAKIRRLMLDNISLEKTLLRLEEPSFHGAVRPRPNPFEVFPPEVWEMIVKKMTLSSDLEMLCLAFRQLEPLVKKTKRAVFLFEDVLPFLAKRLGIVDIIKCRLVCGKWNQDVCALLANWHAPNLVPDASCNDEVTSETHIPDSNPPWRLRNAYNFQNHQKIHEFLSKMADHSENPFLGRILLLTVDTRTELKRFYEAVVDLVQKFGKHVWNLKIKCTRDWHKQITFHAALQETLTYLPDLKYLSVECNFFAHGPSQTKMEHQILSSPLPPLPHLQSLKLALNSQTGIMSAFNSVFSAQIRRLKLLDGTMGNANLKDVCLRGFINLKHLEVEVKSSEDILRVLKFSAPNLKELCIHSKRYPGPLVSITSEQLGGLLKIFHRLEHLDFTYCQIEPGSSLGSRVRFSRLKVVEIAVGSDEDDSQHNLDFLLWLPSLKHLMIDKIYIPEIGGRTMFDERDKDSTLKIRDYIQSGQMLNSNIWTLVPSLKVLELTSIIGNEKYTREMFENRVG